MKTEKLIQYGVRLSAKVLERVDKLAERMSTHGMRYTRAEILRIAMYRGVEQLEAEKKK